MIDIKDYCATHYLSLLGKPFMAKGTTLSLDHRVDMIYTWNRMHREEQKTYLLSNKITRRIETMDLSKLEANQILYLCNNHSNEHGIILDAIGEPVKMSCTYLIKDDCILIDVFQGKFSNMQTQRYNNKQEDLSAINKRFVGSVVISESGIEKTASNALELLRTGVNFKVDQCYAVTMKKVLSELKNVGSPKSTMEEILKEHKSELPYTLGVYNDLSKKRAELEYALKAFLFIHASSTIKVDYISEPKEYVSRGNNIVRDYILVDSLWDTEIDVLNPFAVSGHFTHQPYGKGNSLRKLIYIEPYMKKGYHRRATKDINS